MFGSIKRKTDKGFGFITPEEGGRDIFFHTKALNGVYFNDLQEGDRVEFDVEDTEKGPAAANVTRVE